MTALSNIISHRENYLSMIARSLKRYISKKFSTMWGCFEQQKSCCSRLELVLPLFSEISKGVCCDKSLSFDTASKIIEAIKKKLYSFGGHLDVVVVKDIGKILPDLILNKINNFDYRAISYNFQPDLHEGRTIKNMFLEV